MRTAITNQSTDSAVQRKQHALRSACLCAKVADEYRGADTVVIELAQVTPIVDYFVVTTGTSRRQMHAIADEVDRVLEETGTRRIGIEGYDGDTWVLQDYGDVVMHVFNSETRSLYDLERLWADATKVDWRAVLNSPQ